MKKKNYRLLSLLLAIPLILGGCGNSSSGGGEGGGGGGDPTPTQPTVTGVTIAKPSETTVLDGTRVSLKATVAGDEGVSQKVTWSTSDNTVATVTNGVVNFLKVSKQTKVTITATSVGDSNYKDSVEFTVEHSPFDLKNSRGNPDTSLFLDDGQFIIEDPQDVALIFADVNHTRWYVEATMQIDSFLETDPYPKFGIMASERDDGMWTYEQSHQLFYYVDSVASAQSWTVMNVVKEDNDLVNWDWAHQIGSATASPAVKKGEAFKMGLMRDGNQFYQFYGKATDVTLSVVGSFEYDSFDGVANYVWVGGWATAATVSDPKCLVGDEIDTLYSVPEALSLKSGEETLYLGDSYQIEVNADGLWNRSKLTFTSSDETVATVDEKGVVTANSEAVGTATITVAIEGTELSAEFVIHVTDDKLFNVVLDGKMDDAIWSETVKANAFLLRKDSKNYIKFYGAKNSSGLYIFADYNVEGLKASNPGEWWTHENFEFYLANSEKAWGGQNWVSSMDNGSFVAVGAGQKPEKVFYKVCELGEDEIYHGVFELFMPFGDDKLVKDDVTYFRVGSNPKAGWYSSYNWDGGVNENTLQITATGFAHDVDKTCSEEHVYGDWIVDVAPNCSEAGLAHRDCRFCGHVDAKVLDIDPEAHVYDYENAEITTVPTCVSTGIGTATCTLCGAIQETVLPFDYNNHTDEDYPTSHSYCHSCGIGSHLINAEGDVYGHNFGGWDNKATWTDFGIWSGDFTLTVAFHMDGCLGGDPAAPGDCCWRTVLPVLYDEGYDAGTHKVDKVFRMDWFGWNDGGFTTEENNGSIPAGFDWNKNYEAFSNMDVQLVFTKKGAVVTLDWVWTCLATEGMYVGQSYEYHQSCKLANGDKVGVALSAEWTNYKVTQADFSRK